RILPESAILPVFPDGLPISGRNIRGSSFWFLSSTERMLTHIKGPRIFRSKTSHAFRYTNDRE
ncbi:MAG: hypothetical protein R6U92_03290, partial [Bacillota bacterium]